MHFENVNTNGITSGANNIRLCSHFDGITRILSTIQMQVYSRLTLRLLFDGLGVNNQTVNPGKPFCSVPFAEQSRQRKASICYRQITTGRSLTVGVL